MAQLPAYLADMQREIERYGREYGLDFWDVEFEILDYKRMQEVAAFGGFPVRYPHWRFGMEFEHLTKSHVYGRAYGLDFWDVEFEILDYKRMQEVAAFGGFPVRY